MAIPAGLRLFVSVGAAALMACAGAATAAPGTERRIAQGTLSGVAIAGGSVFKDIPYAAPPVGALRWRAPQPAAHWQGARDASRFGPACVQPLSPPQSIYGEDPAEMSEDWISFARTSVPASPGNARWRPYAADRSYMHFTDRPVAARDLLPGSFALHEDVAARRRATTDQNWGASFGVATEPLRPATAIRHGS